VCKQKVVISVAIICLCVFMQKVQSSLVLMCKVKQLQRHEPRVCGPRVRGPRALSCQCRVLCPRRTQFFRHAPRAETLVFSVPDKRDSSPLSALPQALAARFNARRVDKNAAQVCSAVPIPVALKRLMYCLFLLLRIAIYIRFLFDRVAA
jgi:hypothetical protein